MHKFYLVRLNVIALILFINVAKYLNISLVLALINEL